LPSSCGPLHPDGYCCCPADLLPHPLPHCHCVAALPASRYGADVAATARLARTRGIVPATSAVASPFRARWPHMSCPVVGTCKFPLAMMARSACTCAKSLAASRVPPRRGHSHAMKSSREKSPSRFVVSLALPLSHLAARPYPALNRAWTSSNLVLPSPPGR
jgi:hypothetical protein